MWGAKTWHKAMGHHNEDIPGCFHISNKQRCRHAPLCHTGTHAGMHALKPSIHDFRQFLSYFSWEWTNKRLCCFHLVVHAFIVYWRMTCSLSKTKELHMMRLSWHPETNVRIHWASSHTDKLTRLCNHKASNSEMTFEEYLQCRVLVLHLLWRLW